VGIKSLAIDIGASLVRVAEVELGGQADPRDGATLHAYVERPMPAGVLRDGVIEEPAALAALIRQAVAAAKPSTKNVTVGIGHPSVVVREVDIPAQPIDKVRESLAFHVQDQLPMAPDEAQLDFYPTGEFEAQAGPTLRGLLVAAPRELVRDYVEVLGQAGITPAAIDHSALGLWRASCRGPLMERNVAIVDVGSATTLVCSSQAGVPRLVRALPQSSGDANRAIAAALKGQAADPEQLKREIGMDPSATGNARMISDAVGHALTPLIEAIRNTIVYVSSSNPGAGPERLVLSGGGAYVRGFGQALSSATRLPVVISEPLAGMRMGKKVDMQIIRGQEAGLSTVVGLAMGGHK
jgi:type IV pilus assembly protein PilM